MAQRPIGAILAGRKGRGGIPQLLDMYLLRSFFFYFILLTVGFIVLFEVFTFFELLDDIAQHRTGIIGVINYFIYLASYLFYQLAPLAALVAVLVTLGIMTKNNELVAFKAGGVSLYRISLPLLLAGLALATGLVVLDDTYLPYANQRQDALRNEIKGRPAQTYYQPSRQWIFGENSKIYNYELFDPDHQLFGGLNVFELIPRHSKSGAAFMPPARTGTTSRRSGFSNPAGFAISTTARSPTISRSWPLP